MTPNGVALEHPSILVVGDVMLDRYLWGNVQRISPEAPVPIVRVRERSEMLGGAGNVAANLAGIECRVCLMGVRGDDEAGEQLVRIIRKKGIENRVMTTSLRPTIAKTRVMAQQQQLFRLDEEDPRGVNGDLEKAIFDECVDRIAEFDVVIFSDYGKGVFHSANFCRRLIAVCRDRGVPVLVDPKGSDWGRYEGVACVTPNTAEFEFVTRSGENADEQVMIRAAHDLREQLHLEWLLITRGPKGMCLTGPDRIVFMIPARAREVYDVSGAGDTVIATLAAGLGSGMSFPDAAALANIAAGIVVGKVGTQPVNRKELLNAVRTSTGDGRLLTYRKIASPDAALLQMKAWRASGDMVVFTNGCFDLLHPGHVNLLHQARVLGDRLVVGLNTDASVRRLKGPSRPILSEQDRAAILSALSSVDMVVLFDEDTPLELIMALKPDILVKGADYRPEDVVGGDVVTSNGGRICLVPLLDGYSTTGIADKMKSAERGH